MTPTTPGTTHRTRLAAVVAGFVVLPLGLAACSSSSGAAAPTATVTTTETVTPSATDTPTDTPTETPTETPSPTGTASESPSPTDSPTTVMPSPSGDVKGITVVAVPTKAAPGQKIIITATTDKSLAGKQMYTIKTTNGMAKVLGSGAPIRGNGTAGSYVQLQTSGQLTLVVPVSPLAVGPYSASTPLLASSSPITVTIG
jgi:hypothetical protein